MKPLLEVSQIQDSLIRQNFQNLQDYFTTQNQLLDFKFFEQVFTKAQSGVKLAHGLPSAPLDIIVTHISGSGIVTFKYGSFDKTYIIMDVSGACRIRFFCGAYFNFTSKADTAATDSQQASAT